MINTKIINTKNINTKIIYLLILFFIIYIFLKKTNLFQNIKESFFKYALNGLLYMNGDFKKNVLIKKGDFKPKFINAKEKKEIEKIFLERINNNNNKLYEEKYNNILLNIKNV